MLEEKYGYECFYCSRLYSTSEEAYDCARSCEASLTAFRPPSHPREVSRMRAELLAEIDRVISPWWQGGRQSTIEFMAERLRQLGEPGDAR